MRFFPLLVANGIQKGFETLSDSNGSTHHICIKEIKMKEILWAQLLSKQYLWLKGWFVYLLGREAVLTILEHPIWLFLS